LRAGFPSNSSGKPHTRKKKKEDQKEKKSETGSINPQGE